ncbi:unnamed protein product [marine sediment metagenome]|uniref:Uncharacterized protein n=1 Tax=marine sediment metagenome TaxID=412755 RepID=X0XKH6_9ZZZZ
MNIRARESIGREDKIQHLAILTKGTVYNIRTVSSLTVFLHRCEEAGIEWVAGEKATDYVDIPTRHITMYGVAYIHIDKNNKLYIPRVPLVGYKQVEVISG